MNKLSEAIRIRNVIYKFIIIIYKTIKLNECLLSILQIIITFQHL